LYATIFLLDEGQRPDKIMAAFEHALEVAEAAGAASEVSRILSNLAYQSFLGGEVEDGFRLLARAWTGPEVSRDPWAVGWLAQTESDALLTGGRLETATRVALGGVDTLTHLGFGSSLHAVHLLAMAVEGLFGRGRTAEAAELIDPLTSGPMDRDKRLLHDCRAEIDLLRGEVDAAAQRLHRIELAASVEYARELGRLVAEVAVWAGRPEEALEEVQRLLGRLEHTQWLIFSGSLLTVGMRACADLAESGRAAATTTPSGHRWPRPTTWPPG
jgi:hypothetical protein